MRTTIVLDDELLVQAQRLTGTKEKTALVRQALRALIERESARRLGTLGGSDPELAPIPVRRAEGPRLTSAEAALATFRGAPSVDLAQLQTDVDAVTSQDPKPRG